MRSSTRTAARPVNAGMRNGSSGGAGSRYLDDLMALDVRGTWRYLQTQPASFWLICFYLFFEYVRPQSVWRVFSPP